jgi:DNA polymerase-3 subunit alpha
VKRASHFAHLHLHTQYSILDGAISISKLVERAAKLGMPAVAMTDHGNMFGAVEFHQSAVRAGIKPIIGCEVYVAQGSRFEKDASTGGFNGINHLILLAMNDTGYRNLVELVSKGFLEGFYYKPRVDYELLQQHNEGLIATSGCLSGAVPTGILNGRVDDAWATVERYSRLFKDRYYLELQRHGIPAQDVVNAELIKMHADLGLPLLATNDAHYLEEGDSHSHEALLCVQTGKTLDDPNRFQFTGKGFYVKDPEEMFELFSDHPEAVTNTVELAERCCFELQTGQLQLPEFAVPEGRTVDSYLAELATSGLRERLGLAPDEPAGEPLAEYRERLRHELEIVQTTGFSGYFLIVWDFIRFAREKGIPVGPGRGSAAGSLVAWALKITGIDPVAYRIPFERFLNPERVSMPDIDVDFCMNRRGEVIQYVEDKYNGPGEEGRRVAGIVTFGTMQPKAAVRDVGRVLGLPFGDVDRVAKLIPATLGISLDEAHGQSRELRDAIDADPKIQRLWKLALALEGQIRNPGRHAAGIVISPKPLLGHIPLYRDPRTKDVVTQFDWRKIETVGLIKFDFLGLRTLTIIHETVRRIREHHDPDFDIEAAPLADEKTYALLCNADIVGVFQLTSSTGMADLAAKLQPREFRDLIALVAMFRPGPLQSGMVDDFIERRAGRTKVDYMLPELEEILAETYGVILYQDQVLQIANHLASFTLGQGDLLRRAMGKKIHSEMEKQRARFLEGCEKNGHPHAKVNAIFDIMYQFAGYGFNKAHSAAYALLTHQTAYLKAHYAPEFYAACMTAEWREGEKLDRYMKDAAKRGIEIRAPDVNESDAEFTVTEEGRAIRFGLAGVKNVGEGAVESILESRERGEPYRGLYDFCERVDKDRVNRRVVESLVRAGAFDFLKATRASMFEALQRALDRGQRMQRDRALGQASLFGAAETVTEPPLPEVEEWERTELLAGEKEMLGFFVTGHPLQEHLRPLEFFSQVSVGRIGQEHKGTRMRLGGLVSGLSTQRTRRGDIMARATLEDLSGTLPCVFFPKAWDRCAPLLRLGEPLFLVGDLQMETERVELLVEDAISLDDAWTRLTREVRLHMPAEEAGAERLRELREMLDLTPGPVPVSLRLELPGGIDADLELLSHRVAFGPDLLGRLDRLLGAGATECCATA